ncbi:hypothetical protein K458DRAFT_421086 [Lentithecium fluviatile CBS 122367]|uniref:Uncharacterized protein n=1 Tax=Lentithecium fluviatile CBS 122367 TaxID=1168545 RepID=A0A6G1IRY7_9PLEO|nr:hypothetical protein K458DRAFT_421086 [Lentithecium fluviatile CBS 122367]
MEAPPYSPTAATSERQLPSDYRPSERPEDDEDPLDSLLRRQKTPTSPRMQHHRHWSSSSSAAGNALQPVATAPQTALAPSFHDPFTSFEFPPDYAPVDELARSFRLEAPLIHTTKTSNMPRYQLMQEFSRSGRPRKLHIRRLMAAESRSHSLPSTPLSPSYGPVIRYDEDATMYTMNCYELIGTGYRSYEMRGYRSSTLGGIIKAESGKSLLSGKWTKIWHMTKNSRKDSLNVENEARLQKYGYHADDEWNKRLLFYVKKGIWENGEGRVVAQEGKKGEVEVCETIGNEGWKRDLVVSCWIMQMWMREGLRWTNDVKGW